MNELVAKVAKIEKSDTLSLVYFEFEKRELVMMSLEMKESLNVGDRVVLGVKPTAIFINKGSVQKSSVSNHLKATIKQISNAKLLSSLLLQVGSAVMESIMIRKNVQMLNLKEEQEVDLYFLASELFIKEIRDD